jgi:hypothetical protein
MSLNVTKEFIYMKTSDYKIPSLLPLPKGGKLPLFSKEGIGEIFGRCHLTNALILNTPII